TQTPPSQPGYWQMVDETSTTVFLGIVGHVPSLTPDPPSGGVDQTPGGLPLSWFIARDEFGVPWFVTVYGDTLHIQTTMPAGLGSASPFTVPDAAGALWTLTVRANEEALVTSMVSPDYQVTVTPDLTTTIPTQVASL